MTLPFSDSYDTIDHASQPAKLASPLTTGLPAAWWPCIWGFASLVYAAFWMAESWRASRPFIGPTKLNYLTQDLFSLLLTVGGCYAFYWFFKRRWETLGIVLCVLLAAVAMTLQRF
ncbi:hypothetical protein GGR34_000977 [Microvirga flocculans]|uniref:Uncharacterized protein n=1 Tax=Microvirga flocculans TaxID=217168 RepID=A0A7W6ID82_9HYPH|nr:hypothetical protein [Microvirga flocculans]MBB4039342.1 hypothetical protein [Microvirga flocculans]